MNGFLRRDVASFYDFRNGAAAREVLDLGLSEGTARLHEVPDERAFGVW